MRLAYPLACFPPHFLHPLRATGKQTGRWVDIESTEIWTEVEGGDQKEEKEKGRVRGGGRGEG